MIAYYTVDIEQGDGELLTAEEALYLAVQHAKEGTRLANENAWYLSTNNGGVGYLHAMQMAQTHAQLAAAYAAIHARIIEVGE